MPFIPDLFTGPQGPRVVGFDLAQHYPGLEARETVGGGLDVLHRTTGRWSGVLTLGPYQTRAEARRAIAWLSRLTSGDHYTLLPLGEAVWTDAPTDTPLYVTAAPEGTDEGTALTVNGTRADMAEGMFFTVGDPDDDDTVAPERVRIITGLAVSGGATTIQQWPPLPQAATGAAEPAALVRPATQIRARVRDPGSGAVLFPRAPGGSTGTHYDGSGFGPFIFEWVEQVETGG